MHRVGGKTLMHGLEYVPSALPTVEAVPYTHSLPSVPIFNGRTNYIS